MKHPFWSRLEALVKENKIVIDRPKGSTHPRYPENIYPIDYGFVQNTQSQDKAGVDIWIGSHDRGEINGIVCTLDELKGDFEIKIISGCTDEEIKLVLDFHHFGSQSGILIKKPA
jgi:inorganic pyrophosphatase